LPSFVVVEVYVGLNGRYQAIVILEVAKVVHFAFENAPEAFHGAVVYAATDARHALCHSSLVQSRFKLLTGILKTSVTVKHRVGIRVFGNGQIKGVKYKLVIVVTAYGERDNAFVFEVQDCAQIQLCIISILKFCDVGQPLLVELFSLEITVQNIFRRCYLFLVDQSKPMSGSSHASRFSSGFSLL